MKKEIVYLEQIVVIEYETPNDKKEVLKNLRQFPNSMSVGGGSHRFKKAERKVKLFDKNFKLIK